MKQNHSGRVVGNSYLGITSGLPVIREKSSKSGRKSSPESDPREWRVFTCRFGVFNGT
jgi:hypothetical protein